MNPWDGLSPEQAAVMITAAEEGHVINVLDAWRARIRWAETGTTATPSDLDDQAKRDLTPRFGPIVRDLVDRGYITIAEHFPNNPTPVALSGQELQNARTSDHRLMGHPHQRTSLTTPSPNRLTKMERPLAG